MRFSSRRCLSPGWAIGRRLPFPNVPDLAARLHYYEKHRDQYDTLFIGSSRFRHQVMPEAFDAEANAEGVATRSINIGYAGMWLPESYYFLRQFLALKSTHLKWVVIEFMDYPVRACGRRGADPAHRLLA